MPQRTFDDGFYHAGRARDIAIGNGSANTNVLTEINALQVDVDGAAKGGALEIYIEGTTIMTTFDDYAGVDTSSHYDAWDDIDFHYKNASNESEKNALRRAQIEMDRVIAYFTRLGYTITREKVDSENRIQWYIRW